MQVWEFVSQGLNIGKWSTGKHCDGVAVVKKRENHYVSRRWHPSFKEGPVYSIRNQDPINRIRNPDGAGPRGTNWGLTRGIIAGGIDQGPREELGSAGRIRALRYASGPSRTFRALQDAPGPSGTRQGPSGCMRWRSKPGGGGVHSAHGHWPPSKRNQRGPTYLLSHPPPIAKVGRLFGPQAEGALMRPAAGFGTTRDGSGLVGQSRAPKPAGLTRVPRDRSEPCRMNRGPRGTYLAPHYESGPVGQSRAPRGKPGPLRTNQGHGTDQDPVGTDQDPVGTDQGPQNESWSRWTNPAWC